MKHKQLLNIYKEFNTYSKHLCQILSNYIIVQYNIRYSQAINKYVILIDDNELDVTFIIPSNQRIKVTAENYSYYFCCIWQYHKKLLIK